MTGSRLVVGAVVMGMILPATLFLLLNLNRPAQFFTIAATTFLTWGIADFLVIVLQKPRLKNRTPGAAFREDFERRATDNPE